MSNISASFLLARKKRASVDLPHCLEHINAVTRLSMASRRLSFASAMVSPYPFAPGSSGQIAQKPPLKHTAQMSGFYGR
ncbi:MAG: hypothetical protein KBA28_04480 [Syntrophaceae bacterium]|nr:hypothetical protein [Syntrophaceae bacterium]HQM46445.1 hypothetical protein [Smithellaceae bacterium]